MTTLFLLKWGATLETKQRNKKGGKRPAEKDLLTILMRWILTVSWK